MKLNPSRWKAVFRKYRTSINITVFTGFIVWFIFFVFQNKSAFAPVRNISPSDLIAISSGILLNWIVNSSQTYIILRSWGIKIGFWENCILLTACTTLNYLPMRAGAIMRMNYLKTVHKLRYARFASLMVIRMSVLLFATGITGIAGLAGLYYNRNVFCPELTILFALLIIAFGLAFFIPLPIIHENGNFLTKIWNDFIAGCGLIKINGKLGLGLFILIIVQFFTFSFRFYFAFRVLSIDFSPWVLIVISPVTVLTTLFSITPGNIGLRELIMGYITMLTGTNFNSGILSGTIDRAVLLFLTFTLGLLCVFPVWLRQSRKPAVSEKEDGQI